MLRGILTTRWAILITILALGMLVLMEATPTFAQADTMTSSRRLPVSGLIANPCNDELVTVIGELHLVDHITVDPHGGFHIELHANFLNQGVGLTTGAKYVSFGSSHTSQFISQQLPFETTFTEHSAVIGEGPVADFVMHLTVHITINPAGELTAHVQNIQSECK
jgi:hypothetical protein